MAVDWRDCCGMQFDKINMQREDERVVAEGLSFSTAVNNFGKVLFYVERPLILCIRNVVRNFHDILYLIVQV